MKKLWDAIGHLLDWQRNNSGNTKNRCLEAVRYALKEEGLKLPVSNVDYKGMLAIDNGKTLAANPGRWGWKLLGTSAKVLPLDRPCLVYFKLCAFLPKYMRFAGHIAIYKPSTNVHVANTKYTMSLWWRWRVAYVFLPADD
ncbi:MAG: hypothetical protein M1133_16320 [Armatimonadetes bacterium]|nr:hypothetical protein [Armatimonadota bacterium]